MAGTDGVGTGCTAVQADRRAKDRISRVLMLRGGASAWQIQNWSLTGCKRQLKVISIVQTGCLIPIIVSREM